MHNRDFKIRGRARRQKRRLKSEKAFLQLAHFVKYVGELSRSWITNIQVQKQKENFVVAYLRPP